MEKNRGWIKKKIKKIDKVALQCSIIFNSFSQGCRFDFVSSEMASMSCSSLKNKTNQNKFHIAQNHDMFHKFCPNSGQDIPVPFQPNNVFLFFF